MNGESGGGGGAIIGILVALFVLALALIMVVSMWKLFEKAGKPGWAAIIPIYNVVVMLDIAGRPWWWLLLCIIPLVNIVGSILIGIVVPIDIAKRFGKDVVYGIGMILLPIVFYPLLAFSDAQYEG